MERWEGGQILCLPRFCLLRNHQETFITLVHPETQSLASTDTSTVKECLKGSSGPPFQENSQYSAFRNSVAGSELLIQKARVD